MLIKLTNLVSKYNLYITGVAHFGAHLGQEVIEYEELNIKNIHLFEPQKNLFIELDKKFGKNKKIKIYNFGLGSEEKQLDINLTPSNNGLSASILPPKKHKDLYPEIKFEGTEKIEIKIYDDLNIKDVNFLNIDIQGYELYALEGSKKSLETNIDYIFIEVNKDELYEGNVVVEELDKFLNKYKFIRIETKWFNRFVLWGDALYVKAESLSSYKILKSKFFIFCERFYIFFLIIDILRFLNRFKYRIKQTIKSLIIRNE